MASIFIGSKMYESDSVIIITKTILPNKCIRYDMIFDYTPYNLNVYTWHDKFHNDFNNLLKSFSNNHSITLCNGKNVNVITSEHVVTYWEEDYFEDHSQDCQLCPCEILCNEMGYTSEYIM
jgi:hypothetical protein